MSNRTRDVSLPSGARVTLRGARLEELDLIVKSSKGAAKGRGVQLEESLTRVLQACTVAVVDSGPYVGGFTWAKAVVADRVWGTYQLRVATFGLVYDMPYQCQGCGEKFDAPVNLGTAEEGGDLEVASLPAESTPGIRDGAPVGGTLPNGDRVLIKLITAAETAKAVKVIDSMPDEPLKAAFLVRCGGVIKADGTGLSSAAELRAYLGQMEGPEVVAFQDLLGELDGGVAGHLEIECPTCGLVHEENSIPLGAAFWGLRVGKKAKKGSPSLDS